MLNRLLLGAGRLSRWLVWIGGGMILLSALMVTADVIMRALLNVSLGGADELSGYAFAVATSLGFSFALFERAHVRVDALYGLFPRPLKAVASVLGLVLLVGFAGVVALMAWGLVADTLSHGSRSITPLRTPLALPQVPWLAGWLFFVACGGLVLIAAIARLLRGDVAGADRLIGVKSLDEQIEDERG